MTQSLTFMTHVERDAAFKKSAWGKALSGGADLGIQFFGDVTLAAGKAGQALKASKLGQGALRNSDAVAQAAEEITKAQYGEANRFTKVIDDFTANNSMYALNHPMVKSSNNPGLLAHLLGDSVDRDETALILRSALETLQLWMNLHYNVHISQMPLRQLVEI
jgi:hypothetical protein